jgi:hypothetical protein
MKKLFLIIATFLVMGTVWAQQKKQKSKTPVRQSEAPQGNKRDSTLMRRDVDNMRDDSLRMRYDSARTLQNAPGTRNRNTSGNIQDSINKNSMGARPVLTDTARRGERERMSQPPTPNRNRRDSLRPR